MTTTATASKKAHRYTVVGHTIASVEKRRNLTAIYQTVEFSPTTQRVRVTYRTYQAGDRDCVWYIDDQTLSNAEHLLADLAGPYAPAELSNLGRPQRLL